MRRKLSAMLVVALGATGCTKSPCDPGFVLGEGGNCYRRSFEEDTALPDTAPETGETGTDTYTGPVGTRSLFVEGDFRGANVLGLSIDTLPSWAASPVFMPNLAAILQRGVALNRHQSGAVWTPPSMDSFVLGTSAPEIGADVFVPDTQAGNATVPDSYTTFAEVLSENGYQTGLVTENGFFGDGSNTQQGYDVYQSGKSMSEGVTKFGSMVRGFAAGTPWYGHWHVMGPHEPYIDSDQPAEYYSCLSEIGTLPDGIDFAEDLQAFDIVELWDSWSLDDQQRVAAALDCVYTGQLAWVDDVVFGAMLDDLDSDGALDNTLVVTFSDHGEEFGEHEDPVTGAPNYGHNRSTYGQVGHVLGGFWAQEIVSDTVDIPTDHGDTAPTILSALGIAIPEGMHGTPIGGVTADRILLRYKCGGNRGSQATASYATTRGNDILRLREDGAWESFDAGTDPEELDPSSDRDPDLESAILTLQGRAQSEGWCGGG